MSMKFAPMTFTVHTDLLRIYRINQILKLETSLKALATSYAHLFV